MKNYNKTIKNLFLSAVAVSTLASCQKDFYLEDLEDSQKTVASLEFTNENLIVEIALLERNIDAAHYTITQNETTIAGLEGDNIALTVENDILKAIIEGLEASIYVLEELLKEKDAAILVLDSSSTTYLTEVTNITAEKDALLVQMNDHSAELADAIQQIYALKELILVQANEINSLETENAALRAEVEALRSQLAGAGAGVGVTTEALAAVQADLDAANNEILSLTGTVSTTEAEVARLDAALTEALSAGSSDTTVIEDLRDELRDAITDRNVYRDALEALRLVELGLIDDVTTAEDNLEDAEADFNALQAEINTFITTLLSSNGSTATNDGYELDASTTYATSVAPGRTHSVWNSTINTTTNVVQVEWAYFRVGEPVASRFTRVQFDNRYDAALFYASNGLDSEMSDVATITAFGGTVTFGYVINNNVVTTFTNN